MSALDEAQAPLVEALARKLHPQGQDLPEYPKWANRLVSDLLGLIAEYERVSAKATVTDEMVAAALDARAVMSQTHCYLYATEKCRCGEPWTDAHWMRYVLEAAEAVR